MKQINVYFEDKECKELLKVKGKETWHDFILQLIKGGGANPNPKKSE